MSKTTIGISYLQSLLWTAMFFAVVIGVSTIVELMIVDVIHGNPHRSQNDVAFMMVMSPLMLGPAAAIGALLVFTLPQIFQAWLVGHLERKFGGRTRFAVLLALPLTAVLTWYCYDYLTPSDLVLGINAGPDWRPYQHGISISRYLGATGFQALVTVFGLVYFDASYRDRSTIPVTITALALVLTVSVILGYESARQQIRLL